MRKIFKRTLIGLVIFIGALFVLMYFTDTLFMIKAIRTTYLRGHASVSIDDYSMFYTRDIETGNPQPWEQHAKFNQNELPEPIKKLNDKFETVSFLLIKDGKLIHESYYLGYTPKSPSHVMSVTKSITSMLLQFAIQDGYIKGLNQKVMDFIPEFGNSELGQQLEVQHLSSLTSGIYWHESMHSIISSNVKLHFDDELENQLRNVSMEKTPGTEFYYKECDHGLLGMVIRKATGKNLSEYTSEKIWKPLGCEQKAFWELDDKNGVEKGYSGFCSNARDMAKLGQLFLNQGNWKGKQLIDSTFIKFSTTPTLAEIPYYGSGWWLGETQGTPFYTMRGFLGQYVTVIPSENIILVRFGKNRDVFDEITHTSIDHYTFIEESIKFCNL